jgi:hypothetical protein
MAQIENKINKYQYNGLKELGQDVTLLATNARTFNEDSSLLYRDATAIEVSLLVENRSSGARANLSTGGLRESNQRAVRSSPQSGRA